MESFDDDIDVIEGVPPRVLMPPSQRSPVNGQNGNDGDGSKQVLTSDAEELAELMTHRSLEKYAMETLQPPSPRVVKAATLNAQRRRAPPPTCGKKRNLANLWQPLILRGDSESEEESSQVYHDGRLVITSSPADTLSHPAAYTSRRRKAQVVSDGNDGNVIELAGAAGFIVRHNG